MEKIMEIERAGTLNWNGDKSRTCPAQPDLRHGRDGRGTHGVDTGKMPVLRVAFAQPSGRRRGLVIGG